MTAHDSEHNRSSRPERYFQGKRIRRNLRADISPAKRRRIYERDGWKCIACGATKELTLDHRIPISRGGTNADSNLQTMCVSCNKAKGNS